MFSNPHETLREIPDPERDFMPETSDAIKRSYDPFATDANTMIFLHFKIFRNLFRDPAGKKF
jgi:hypothetical protein